MDFGTLAGMIFAVAGLLGGMVFKHVGFEKLANPAAVFIILVGTVGAVMNAFPLKDVSKVGGLFRIIFIGPKVKMNNKATIEEIMEYVQIVRKSTVLELEKLVEGIKDPFMKRGIDLLLLAQDSENINDILSEDIEAMEQRHLANAQIFSQAGTYAPTLGVLGAVIGLIAALGNLEDMTLLGEAISAAFMATVFGIFTGYVLWHPFANKLKRFSKKEVVNKMIIKEGILAIADGVFPDVAKERMLSHLESKERNKIKSGRE